VRTFPPIWTTSFAEPTLTPEGGIDPEDLVLPVSLGVSVAALALTGIAFYFYRGRRLRRLRDIEKPSFIQGSYSQDIFVSSVSTQNGTSSTTVLAISSLSAGLSLMHLEY
jgi:hypothetical protein